VISAHALAGVAIATMTSLRYRPTTDSGTDIATLLRRALAEVCSASSSVLHRRLSVDDRSVRSTSRDIETC